MTFTLDDLRWLLDRGIVRIDAHYNSKEAHPELDITWELPEGLLAVIEANKDDLYIQMRERDGARFPVLE